MTLSELDPRADYSTGVDAAGRILVAVDAAGVADDAVEWAAAEAAVRGLALRIVHALPTPRAFDPTGLDAWQHLDATMAVAEHVLRSAAAGARAVVSDLDVSTEILHGSAGWALEQAARGASLLVLGSRGRTSAQRLLAGSVSGRLAARAPCPIVVVRHQECSVAGAPVVVAGVVPGAAGLAATEYAFQAAWQRRVPLRLVYVAPEDATLNALAGVSFARTAVAGPEAIPDPAIVRAIARWRRTFPGIEVTITGAVGDPAAVLLAESAGSALLVLASAGGRRRAARHLTSVGQRLLPKARCPVAVVGHVAADELRRQRTPVSSRSPEPSTDQRR